MVSYCSQDLGSGGLEVLWGGRGEADERWCFSHVQCFSKVQDSFLFFTQEILFKLSKEDPENISHELVV